jgi:Mrp family chromosome partitioning ATPase
MRRAPEAQGDNVRLVWLNAAATTWRQIALESLGFGVLALAVTVILTHRSYEALVVLEPLPAAEQSDVRLAHAVCGALDQTGAEPGVRLSTQVLAPAQCWLSCRSERRESARESCRRSASAAEKRFESVRIVKSGASLPDSDDGFQYGLLAPLTALAWLIVRVRQTHSQQRAREEQAELEGFWTVQRSPAEAPDDAQIAPSFRAPAEPRKRVRTLSGMQPMAAIPEPMPTSAPLQLPEEIVTRVVFQVGGNPHRPDLHVLTERTLEQLSELKDELLAGEAKTRVVRIASGVGSRYAKTQVAAQLAGLLSAQPDTKVVVIEGDVDSPALHKAMQLEAPIGLGFSEQMQRMQKQSPRATLSINRIEGNLHALLESRASSPEVLGSPLYTSVLHKLRSEYAFVIVDGPVLDNWPDVTHLAGCVDSVVWVTGPGSRVRDSLALAEQHFNPDDVTHLVAADDWGATG